MSQFNLCLKSVTFVQQTQYTQIFLLRTDQSLLILKLEYLIDEM